MTPRLLAAALVLACASVPAPALAKESLSSAPLQIQATDVRYEGNLAIAEGNVVIAQGENTIYCDHAQYDRSTSNVLLSGKVRLFRNGTFLTGDRAIYNVDSRNFMGAAFRSGSGPFMAEAHTISSVQPGIFEASQTFITTDNVADPAFSLRAKKVRYLPNDHTEYENVTVYVGRVPILWVPYLYQPADKAQSFSVVPGSRGIWGAFLLTSFAFPISPNAVGTARLDYMSKRGVAVGLDSIWGRFRSYYIEDQNPGTNPLTKTPQAIAPSRYRISVQDRSALSDTVYTTVNVNKLSDINFLKDFSPNDMRTDPNPDSLLALTKWDEDFTITLQARNQINRDFDGTGRIPELALDFKRQPFLDSSVFYEGETSVGKMNRRYGRASGLLSYDTVREDTFHQWSLPKTYGGWLSVVPRVGARATHYSRSVFDTRLSEGDQGFAGGGSLTRITLNAGVEASFKLSRTFESVENRRLGLDGLRHVVQPFADFSVVNTNQDASKVLPFDHLGSMTRLPAIDFPQFNAVDSITDWQVLRLGVRNRLQTRRDNQTLNWLELESFFDTNFKRPDYFRGPLSDSGTFSNVFNRARWNPLPWLNMTVDSQLPLLDTGFSAFDSSTNFQVNRDLTVQLSNRYISGNRVFTNSNLVGGGARLRLNDNWAFGFLNSYDFAFKEAQSQQYSLDRDLRSWIGSLTLVVREQDAKKDIAVLLSLTLKDIPKLSIPLKYDTAAIGGAGTGKNR
jgi:lipopolysaccharide assembly outer membrane protein LptD (OstA)